MVHSSKLLAYFSMSVIFRRSFKTAIFSRFLNMDIVMSQFLQDPKCRRPRTSWRKNLVFHWKKISYFVSHIHTYIYIYIYNEIWNNEIWNIYIIYNYIYIYIYIYNYIYIYIYIYEQKTGLYCCITTKGFQILINFCISQYLIMSVKFLHVQFLEKCKFADEWTFFHSISEHFVCVTEQFWMNIHYKKLFTPLQFQTVRLN